MATKLLPAKVKATEPSPEADSGEGTFEAIVATYDTDSVNDRIVPGAFKNTLAEWKERAENGERLPVVWSHDHGDPYSHIGEVLDAKETDEGLWVKGALDLDNPKAAQVHRLIKGGRIRNWSFAYDVRSPAEQDEKDGANLLKDLGVFEVGPTLIGANQATRTQSVKSVAETATKAGRTISAKNEAELKGAVDALSSALDRIKSVLDQVASPEAPKAQAIQVERPQSEGPAKDEEPQRAKSEEPSLTGPDLDLLAAEITLKMKGF